MALVVSLVTDHIRHGQAEAVGLAPILYRTVRLGQFTLQVRLVLSGNVNLRLSAASVHWLAAGVLGRGRSCSRKCGDTASWRPISPWLSMTRELMASILRLTRAADQGSPPWLQLKSPRCRSENVHSRNARMSWV